MDAGTQQRAEAASRALLRHTVATLAYRGSKALRGAPEGFAAFRLAAASAGKTRTPSEILGHVGDLLDWALSLARGQEEWHNSPAVEWDKSCQRFFHALAALDTYLASSEPLATPAEKLFQGPVADALAHVGQMAMLRRLAGAPVKGENYCRAEIVAGRVGGQQATPQREFD